MPKKARYVEFGEVSAGAVIAFPPPVSDVTENCEGGKCQVDDTCIQGRRRSFAHLRSGPAANGTLCGSCDRAGDENDKGDQIIQ